ncbi:MAG: tandem-95 repeat protein, partial [Pirellulaceae bacterium]
SVGTSIGVSILATDADATNNTVTYALDDDAGGRFAIDLNSGVVTVVGGLDYETATSHNITVRATSSDGSTATQMLVIAVTNVNEEQVLVVNSPLTLDEGSLATIANSHLLTTDVDHLPSQLTYRVDSLPTHGVLQRDGVTLVVGSTFTQEDVDVGRITYSHDGSETSVDGFSFTVDDGLGATDGGVFQINVNALNDRPIASIPAGVTTVEDIPLVLGAANAIQISDADANGGAVQVTLQVAGGDVTLSQTVGLTFVSGDGVGDALMTFTGTVSDINLALDGLVFQPNANFFGAAGIQISVDDLGNSGAGGPMSVTETVAINVSQVNDIPVASDNEYSTNEDNSVSGNLLTDDSGYGVDADIDGDALQVVNVGTYATNHGSVTIHADGTFVYSPDQDFSGLDSFSYSIRDGHGGTDSAVVTVRVLAVNDAPSGQADEYFVTSDQVLVQALSVLLNDSDVEGQTLSAQLHTVPVVGSLVFQSDGTFRYTPAIGYAGPVTFSYLASDGANTSNPITVTVHVSTVTLPPDPTDGGGSDDTNDDSNSNSNNSSSGDTEDSDTNSTDDETPVEVTSTTVRTPVKPIGNTGTGVVHQGAGKGDSESSSLVSQPLEMDRVDSGFAELDGNSVPSSGSDRAELVRVQYRGRSLPGREFEQVDMYEMEVAVAKMDLLWRQYDAVERDVMENLDTEEMVVAQLGKVGVGLSMGYVAWTLRSGYLMALLSSSLPTWTRFDPIMILEENGWKRSDEDDESLETIIEKGKRMRQEQDAERDCDSAN